MNLQIEHIGVWTADLDRLRLFYVEHFRATPGDKYENPAKGFESYFLSFGGGARVEIMASKTVNGEVPAAVCPGYAHLALSVDSESEVDALTERLRSSGVLVVDGPRHTGDGGYESVVLDPDGNRIEITT